MFNNLLDRVFWFLLRDGWSWTLVAGALLRLRFNPVLLLFFERVRSGRVGKCYPSTPRGGVSGVRMGILPPAVEESGAARPIQEA